MNQNWYSIVLENWGVDHTRAFSFLFLCVCKPLEFKLSTQSKGYNFPSSLTINNSPQFKKMRDLVLKFNWSSPGLDCVFLKIALKRELDKTLKTTPTPLLLKAHLQL